MQKATISIILPTLLISLLILNCSSAQQEEEEKIAKKDDAREMKFHSDGSTFSPVLVLNGEAEVLWTWHDGTTSTSISPVKDYGSAQLRQNKLKVTPWSALRRINIGYDGGDGGSKEIEYVADQQISLVENLDIVAPFLKEWCSSYNQFTSLDFSNFINLETIECYLSSTLKDVVLTNTPKLKRVCFENNDIMELDLSDCNSLEDLRGAYNNYSTIIFPQHTENLWHLCVGNNPQITDQNLLSDLSKFPNLVELIISGTNQKGALILPKTAATGRIDLNAEKNAFTSLSLKGSLQNKNYIGNVFMPHNQFTSVDITGCVQITNLDLSDNKLDSETIDNLLKQIDDFGRLGGTIDLRDNQPPTNVGLGYKASLENKGWIVHTDEIVTSSIHEIKPSSGFKVFPNLSNGTVHIELDKFQHDEILVEIRNVLGKLITQQKIYNNKNELFINQPLGNVYFVTLSGKNWTNTVKIIL